MIHFHSADGTGNNCQITLDGKELDCVAAADIRLRPDQTNKATLEVIGLGLDLSCGEFDVRLSAREPWLNWWRSTIIALTVAVLIVLAFWG
jgi:hypothetical protein